MKKILVSLLAAATAFGILTGCGSSKTEQTSAAAGSTAQAAEGDAGQAAADSSKMTAMIIIIPQGDPFLTLAYNGVKQYAQEYGKEAKIIEALDKSEYTEQVRAMAEAGANPIYVVWDDLADVAFNLAPDFPDTQFILVDTYATSDLPNVKTIVVEPQESAFIAGVVAAKTTKTKQVAWIGNMDLPTVNRWRAGFEAGVKYGDPDVACESIYIGSSDDPNKGGELAKQLIGKGADIVMHSANQAGLGVIRACEEMGVLSIGSDEWQGAINEDIVFWSALKDTTGATYAAGKSVSEGQFKPGMEIFGLDSGAKLYDDRDYQKLPEDLQKTVDEVFSKIQSGEIQVPGELEK